MTWQSPNNNAPQEAGRRLMVIATLTGMGSATTDNETRHARFPLPNPLPQAGEEANESLREFHVNA